MRLYSVYVFKIIRENRRKRFFVLVSYLKITTIVQSKNGLSTVAEDRNESGTPVKYSTVAVDEQMAKTKKGIWYIFEKIPVIHTNIVISVKYVTSHVSGPDKSSRRERVRERL